MCLYMCATTLERLSVPWRRRRPPASPWCCLRAGERAWKSGLDRNTFLPAGIHSCRRECIPVDRNGQQYISSTGMHRNTFLSTGSTGTHSCRHECIPVDSCRQECSPAGRHACRQKMYAWACRGAPPAPCAHALRISIPFCRPGNSISPQNSQTRKSHWQWCC